MEILSGAQHPTWKKCGLTVDSPDGPDIPDKGRQFSFLLIRGIRAIRWRFWFRDEALTSRNDATARRVRFRSSLRVGRQLPGTIAPDTQPASCVGRGGGEAGGIVAEGEVIPDPFGIATYSFNALAWSNIIL